MTSKEECKKEKTITVDIADVSRLAHDCNMDSGSGALVHVRVDAAAPPSASIPSPPC